VGLHTLARAFSCGVMKFEVLVASGSSNPSAMRRRRTFCAGLRTTTAAQVSDAVDYNWCIRSTSVRRRPLCWHQGLRLWEHLQDQDRLREPIKLFKVLNSKIKIRCMNPFVQLRTIFGFLGRIAWLSTCTTTHTLWKYPARLHSATNVLILYTYLYFYDSIQVINFNYLNI
jgi:hypothetical protein